MFMLIPFFWEQDVPPSSRDLAPTRHDGDQLMHVSEEELEEDDGDVDSGVPISNGKFLRLLSTVMLYSR
jgi:hypothetical protein